MCIPFVLIPEVYFSFASHPVFLKNEQKKNIVPTQYALIRKQLTWIRVHVCKRINSSALTVPGP